MRSWIVKWQFVEKSWSWIQINFFDLVLYKCVLDLVCNSNFDGEWKILCYTYDHFVLPLPLCWKISDDTCLRFKVHKCWQNLQWRLPPTRTWNTWLFDIIRAILIVECNRYLLAFSYRCHIPFDLCYIMAAFQTKLCWAQRWDKNCRN